MSLFARSRSANTDKNLIDEASSRAIENVFPNREALKAALSSGSRLSFYFGIDPTGPTIHLGHVIPLLVMKRLQALGHEIVILMGDFTAMIGDPSDKTAARKPLTRKEVLENLKNYKEQASAFIDFKGRNKARIAFNSTWLSKMTFGDVLELASKMTVDQMMKRDMFEKRAQEGKPIFIHEFMYPLMQGYDSIALGIDGEVGGNDQTFNMLAGRDLVRSIKNKEKFVIATKLLVDSTGKKMGKSEGNMVMLSDTPANTFGKIMSWSDDMIVTGFEYATCVPMARVEEVKKGMVSGTNPRDLKAELAYEVVSLCFGPKQAEAAKASFTKAFSEKKIPEDLKEVCVAKDSKLSIPLLEQGIIASKSELKRLLDSGAISDITTGEKLSPGTDYTIVKDLDLKVGKHRFIKIRIT